MQWVSHDSVLSHTWLGTLAEMRVKFNVYAYNKSSLKPLDQQKCQVISRSKNEAFELEKGDQGALSEITVFSAPELCYRRLC
jgi:hypothetical protein